MASSEKIIAGPDRIVEYIPQKPPMVMIGSLISAEGIKTVTELEISSENIFFSDGYLREPGIIENIAQTAAAGVGYDAKQKEQAPPVGFIGGIRNLKISRLPAKGDIIRTEVTVEHQVFDATVVIGRTFLGGEMIAEAELKIFLMPSADLKE